MESNHSETEDDTDRAESETASESDDSGDDPEGFPNN